MAGLLDFLQTPEGQGLLSGVASYAMNARRGTPVNNIGRGLAGGLAGYAGAQQDIAAKSDKELQDQLRRMQLEQGKAQMENAAQLQAKLKSMYKPGTPGINPATPVDDSGYQMPGIPATPATFGGNPVDPALGELLPYLPPEKALSYALPKAEDSPFAKIDPSKFTPESVKAFAQSKDYGSLAPIEKPEAQAYGQDMREYAKTYGLDLNDPKQAQAAYKAVNEQKDRRVPKQSVVVNPALDPFKNEQSLRKEYQDNPFVKSAAEMNNAFRTIEAAYKRPSAANDLAMATKYMKILDPTSVVRESEFALAVNATGLMDKVYNYAHMIKTGEKLNPTQRKDFYDSAKAINDAFQGEANKVGSTYRGIGSQYGLSPDNVTLGAGKEKPKPPKPPMKGQVKDGYRFKGGNPADKNNWEAVK